MTRDFMCFAAHRSIPFPLTAHYENSGTLFLVGDTAVISGAYCPHLMFFRVVGMKEYDIGGMMEYFIQIVGFYGIEMAFDPTEIYQTAHAGTPTDQAYGLPPFEIGRVYGKISSLEQSEVERIRMIQPFFAFFEVERDAQGSIWLYGRNFTDLSSFSCAVPITDAEENSVYKPGKHDKAIAYLEAEGMVLPTFDYKCEAYAFYEEYVRRCSQNQE